MILALYIAAGTLELAGLIVVGVGFRRTWREHADGQDFREPLNRWARLWWSSVAKIGRRILGRPRKRNVVNVHASGGIVLGGHAQTVVHRGDLPDPVAEPGRFADVVHKRLNELNVTTQNLQHRLATETKAHEQALAKLREHVDAQRQDADDQTRKVAVGGLRLEVVGWLLLLFGIAVGTAANLAAYAS